MSQTLNRDGQPYISFNRGRNQEKSAYVLRGIVQGIVADQTLAEIEILYLDVWLKSQMFLNLEGDTLDIVESVKHVLNDRKVSTEELLDLKQLLDDVIEYGYKDDTPNEEPRINEFIGLIKGVCSDGKLKFEELGKIQTWASQNPDLANCFPVEPVVNRIRAIREDGIVDPEEEEDLLTVLTDIAGDDFQKTGDVDGALGEIFCDHLDHLDHQGKTFCFTGKFLSGTRRNVEEEARRLGASSNSRVTRDVDILVIGTITSRDWRFQNFGRKIEYAMQLRKESGMPIILSEKMWVALTTQFTPQL